MPSNTALSSTHKPSYFTEGPLPSLPLPPVLTSTTPGTWAYDTMSRRIDSEILQRTLDENQVEFNTPDFAVAKAKFEDLRAELQSAGDTKLRGLTPYGNGKEGREYEEWTEILAPYLKEGEVDTWLTAPWMMAEFYVYRRLLEALGYFDDGNGNPATIGYDPFLHQKTAGLVSSVAMAAPILTQMTPYLTKGTTTDIKEGLGLASAFALWGNKMDLSIWPADTIVTPAMFAEVLASANDNLLHDDTAALTTYLQELVDARSNTKPNYGPGGASVRNKKIRVDIIVDNAGFELIMDLVLADYLISSGIADTVRFQLKAHPTFVSDAMESDLRQHVQYYATNDDAVIAEAGNRWQSHLDSGKWECHEHNFWVQPPPMWNMPLPLRTELSQNCDLAFVKGDANYRRLLGDLEWNMSDPFQQVVGDYFPCPVCALRTLKAEVGCGMREELVVRAKSLDENWSTNGRFGVVHFSRGHGL